MHLLSPLRPGDTVAVIAPSGLVAEGRLEAGAAEIERAGFVPFIHPQCHHRHGRFSGTDAERLAAVHQVFGDSSIRAVLCTRGGYGTQRFVDDLDGDLIRRNAKPFVGYSDITALLNAIPRRAGFPAFHGPMITDLGGHNSPESWDHLWRVLRGDPVCPSDHPAVGQSAILVEGTATGRLWGGNLALLATACGTPSQIAPEILFFEDVGEDLYRFDRMLWQMKRAGVFRALRGVVVGDLVGVEDKGPPAFGLDAEGIVSAHFGDLGVPVVLRFPAGHGHHHATLPIGASVTLEAKGHAVRLTHTPLFEKP